MTEAELAKLLERYEWKLDMIRRYKTRFAYAKLRRGKVTKSRYIGTERKLSTVSKEDVLRRIGVLDGSSV